MKYLLDLVIQFEENLFKGYFLPIPAKFIPKFPEEVIVFQTPEPVASRS
jgi:hypothetical protein